MRSIKEMKEIFLQRGYNLLEDEYIKNIYS